MRFDILPTEHAMRLLFTALILATAATQALANPVPVTNTTKAPYRASKTYCNDALLRPSEGENIACYNHDACYSDPQGRSRKDCDLGYLADMKKAGMGMIGQIKYEALRSWGKSAWERCRENDRRRKQAQASN